MKKPIVVALAMSLFLAATQVSAQSLFNSAGLGRPLDPVDGRGRALGSFGIGLPEGYVSPSDPAAAARLFIPSGVIVGQPSWVDATENGVEAGDIQGTRFPLFGLAYPAFGGMIIIHAGSVFDQRFEGRRLVSVDVGDGPVQVVDEFEQDGGISRLAIGYARMITPTLSAGLTIARYTGSTTRTLNRDFQDLALDGTEDFSSRQNWGYSGTAVTAGVSRDFGAVGRLATSVTWSTSLDADPRDDDDAPDRSFDLPLEFRLGGSALLAPGLVLVASAMYADWSDTGDDFLDGVDGETVLGFGAGVEFSNFRMLGRRAPLRLGYRHNGLPFTLGLEDGSESSFTGGFGFIFTENNGNVLAGADFGLERGERTAGPLSEDFWRLTLSLRLAGL